MIIGGTKVELKKFILSPDEQDVVLGGDIRPLRTLIYKAECTILDLKSALNVRTRRPYINDIVNTVDDVLIDFRTEIAGLDDVRRQWKRKREYYSDL